MTERARETAEMVLGGLVVLGSDQSVSPLLRERREPLVDLGEGLHDLPLPCCVRRGFQLALQFGAGQTQRLGLSHALWIHTLGALLAGTPLLFALFHPLGEARFRVDESFSCVTHTLRLSTYIRPMHNGFGESIEL